MSLTDLTLLQQHRSFPPDSTPTWKASLAPLGQEVGRTHLTCYSFLCYAKQECIPVGCVPSATIAIKGAGQFPLNFPLGCGPVAPPRTRHWDPPPRDQAPPSLGPSTPPRPATPWNQAPPPGPGTPLDQAPHPLP